MPLTGEQLRLCDQEEYKNISKRNFEHLYSMPPTIASSHKSAWLSMLQKRMELPLEMRVKLEADFRAKRKAIFDEVRKIDPLRLQYWQKRSQSDLVTVRAWNQLMDIALTRVKDATMDEQLSLDVHDSEMDVDLSFVLGSEKIKNSSSIVPECRKNIETSSTLRAPAEEAANDKKSVSPVSSFKTGTASLSGKKERKVAVICRDGKTFNEGSRQVLISESSVLSLAAKGVPLASAAQALGICRTSMKTVCRKFNITTWPCQGGIESESAKVKTISTKSSATSLTLRNTMLTNLCPAEVPNDFQDHMNYISRGDSVMSISNLLN